MAASLWILATTFLTVLTYVFVKLAPEELWFGDFFLVRSVFLFVGILLLSRGRTPLGSAHPRLHALRGATGITALLINIIAAQHLPLATAQTLAYTSPLFVAAATVVLRLRAGKRPGAGGPAAVLIGFAGVYLTLGPNLDGAAGVYGLLALVSSLCAAVSALTLHRLGHLGEPVLRTAFWFGASSLAVALVLWLAGSKLRLVDLLAVPELLGVGLCTLGAQLAQTKAWGQGATLLCANLQFSAIFFSVLLGWLVFGETPSSGAAFGMALILAAEVGATLFEHYARTRGRRS